MELTPMMQQYLATKEQHPEAILFFRLGDFYEMFFDDARIVSKELSLTLTSRSGNTDKAPMCGVPYHAAEGYINKLVSRGYKVAIAEQIGDPKAKGLTKREVIKVITPGTVLSESALKDSANNYIALVYEREEQIILAGADISTGNVSMVSMAVAAGSRCSTTSFTVWPCRNFWWWASPPLWQASRNLRICACPQPPIP